MKPIQWVLGFSALTVTLTIATELGMGELAATLAIVITASALLVNGGQMFDNLNKLVS